MRTGPSITDLFAALDRDADGLVSRTDLHAAAAALRWHWNEAPLYAVLDRLTLDAPLTLDTFTARLTEVLEDRRGPYGRVLHAAPPPPPPPTACVHSSPHSGTDVAAASSGLLVIDPQRAFTCGSWMRSLGRGGEGQVAPIREAFGRCAALLARPPLDAIIFTRCPFPPQSYEWDERLSEAVDATQPYIIKPGNSALWPPSNGFSSWIEALLRGGRNTLVVGGCTLNSCVRVTVVQTLQRFTPAGLGVVVDLSLCGARVDNYQPSPEFGGRSSVEAAIAEMTAAGACVVDQARWRQR